MAGDADTIFALSSGAPPAAIGIIRISGPDAAATLTAFAGGLPEPRCATLRALRDPADGALLDRALLLWFPGPATATGEDVAELHVHGGRAVVAAVLSTLSARPGLRPAGPGEFTRRALMNGRIDLAEAEGLADLLSAETETQRRAALYRADGHLSRRVEEWRSRLLGIVAQIEADIEFSDESVIEPAAIAPGLEELVASIAAALASAPAERMRGGIRVVIAGPPNAGKSSLLNALVGRNAALVSEIAGTTRDVIEAPVAIDGLPFLLCDTAGIRESTDPVERMGIDAARGRADQADVLLWLGDPAAAPDHGCCIRVAAKTDIRGVDAAADIQTSAVTGAGLPELQRMLQASTRQLLRPDSLTVRQQAALASVHSELRAALEADDCLFVAEHLRVAIRELGKIDTAVTSEDVLGEIFSRFCIGK